MASRVLEFSMSGDFISGWEDLSTNSDIISEPYGLAFDSHNDLWISDAASNTVMRFTYPGNE
jgi:streptogramin lyase